MTTTIEDRLRAIEQRNARVELEKSWETSWFRRSLIATFTFVTIGAYMSAIGVSRPWLNAVIPTTGFLLSTIAMPMFKDWWLTMRNK